MPHDPPPLSCRVLSLPKQGHTPEEFEDAWKSDPARGRFAIGDGVSECAFAALWANLLVEGFLAARRPRNLASWVGAVQQRWAAVVMPLQLPWYAEMKREEGDFATVLGVSIPPSAPWRWQAMAVGDSCLVRV
jgi:hypothetical protein